MDLLELAKHCEAATGPDRSIDGLIAHAIGCSMPDDPAGWPPRYTASLDAALTLVPANHDIKITQASGPGRRDWSARCQERDDWGSKPNYGANALGPALALTAAALRARANPCATSSS
jgi:hypothetical protein